MNKEPQKTKLEVDNRTIARFWLILLAILASIGLIFWARNALVIFGMAIFLAVAMNPMVTGLSKTRLLRGRRSVSAILSYMALIIVIILAVWVIVPVLIEQITTMVRTAPEAVNNLFDNLSGLSFFENWGVGEIRSSVLGMIDTNKQTWLANIGSSVFASVGPALTSLVSFTLLIVISLLLSIELPEIKKYVFSFYRSRKKLEHHQTLLRRMYSVVVGFVSGQMLVALINSLMACLVIFILSTIFPVPQGMIALFGLVLLLGAIIPVFGSTIGLVLSALLMVIYSWQASLIFTIYYLIYQQIEGNLISPMIQSKRVDLSLLLILISVTLGTFMFGIIGGVVAIPAVGCIKILFEDYLTTRKD